MTYYYFVVTLLVETHSVGTGRFGSLIQADESCLSKVHFKVHLKFHSVTQ